MSRFVILVVFIFGLIGLFAFGLGVLVNGKRVVVLLQNSNEIRPSGGFMGSYMKFDIENLRIINPVVEDIYQPDGQIKGHVEPPYPIQEAFGQGWWRLRDANWDVDFRKSALAINWFFKEGGEREADILVAVNLNLVKKMLGLLGEVKPETYDEVVTQKNIDILAQKYAQVGFEPGSTAKRDFLGAVGYQLEQRILNGTANEKMMVARLLWSEAIRGEILVWSLDEKLQNLIKTLGFDGRVERRKNEDLLYVVDSNLGSNKANCCMEKNVSLEKIGNTNLLTVQWKNNNLFETPRLPIFYGGDYLNYVRVVVLDDYEISEVKVGDRVINLAAEDEFKSPTSLRQGLSEEIYRIENRDGFRIVGMWVKVAAMNENKLQMKMTNINNSNFEKIKIMRQPGEASWKFKLIVNGEVKKFLDVENDLVISGYGK